jgi:hypothetical protein
MNAYAFVGHPLAVSGVEPSGIFSFYPSFVINHPSSLLVLPNSLEL